MPENSRRGRRQRRQIKDRVLQARIPEQLDDELRDRAEQLGLSVSTVVRNVLLHTFDLVEDVVTDTAQIARAIQGREIRPNPTALAAPGPEAAESDAGATVIGWQEAVLNQNGICDTCNVILPVGQRAAFGLPVRPRPVLLCLDCLAALSATTTTTAGDQVAHPTPQQASKAAPAKTGKQRKQRKKPAN